MVRNEVDVIRGTVTHMAYHCDDLIIMDNGSADGTRDVLADLAKTLPLKVIDDPDRAYYQARKMTNLARMAAENNTDELWIIPFDADELWNCWDDPHKPIREMLAGLSSQIVQAALFDYRATAIDPAGSSPFATMQWCTAKPAELPKVAFRWQEGAEIWQGNHGVSLPAGGIWEQLLRVNHFPYRSAQQFVAKALQGSAAYALTDLPEDQGAHWRAYGRLCEAHGTDILEGVFRQYFWALSPTDSGLVHQPVTYHGDAL
jgi:hypothetical protein